MSQCEIENHFPIQTRFALFIKMKKQLSQKYIIMGALDVLHVLIISTLVKGFLGTLVTIIS